MTNALRTIAEKQLDLCFPGLGPRTRDELATSLVRQWIGNDGQAVIVTLDTHVWFRMTPLEDGQTQIVRTLEPQTFVDHMRKSRVLEKEIPRLLHELSVQQSTECVTDYGEKVRLRVDPGKRRFFVELVLDDKDWHRDPQG